MQKKFIAVMILMSSLIMALPESIAGEGTSGDYMVDIGTKFGRGLLNIVTSPADIPCTAADTARESGGAGGYFVGMGKGLGFMLRRILVGATEVGTFMIPAERTLPPVCQKQTWALPQS